MSKLSIYNNAILIVINPQDDAFDQHFLLFRQMFFTLKMTYSTILARFELSSAKAFNKAKSTVLSCGKELTLPDMPILGSFNSAANKDVVSKEWTNGDTVI